MIKIGIVDDDKSKLIEINRKIISEFKIRDIVVETYQYSRGSDIIEILNSNKVSLDIMFLNMHLPDMPGTDVANYIRKKNRNMLLVFISAYDECVFEAFDYDVVAYIRKKEFDDKINHVVKRLIEKYTYTHNKFLFKNSDGYYKVNLNDIVYMESNNHAISIYDINNTKINITASLSSLEKEFSIHNFCRIYSGILVNLKYVHSIEKTRVIVKYANEVVILPTSRYRIRYIKQLFQNYLNGI